MSWAALFERAAAFGIDEAAVVDALATRRRRPERSDDPPEEQP